MASKRHLRRRQCENKKRFASSEEGRRHIPPKVNNVFYNVYRCQFCKGYHVGRQGVKAHNAHRERIRAK